MIENLLHSCRVAAGKLLVESPNVVIELKDWHPAASGSVHGPDDPNVGSFYPILPNNPADITSHTLRPIQVLILS